MTARLEQIAAQLAGRVREDDPEANARWLEAVTDDDDRWALLFVLAAAVQVDRPWVELVSWHTGEVSRADVRRRQWRDAKKRSRTVAA